MVRRVGIILPLLAVAIVAASVAPCEARLSKGVAKSSVKLYVQQALATKEQDR